MASFDEERGRFRPYRSSKKVEWSRERSSRSSARSSLGSCRRDPNALFVEVGVILFVDAGVRGVEGLNPDAPVLFVPVVEAGRESARGSALLLLE